MPAETSLEQVLRQNRGAAVDGIACGEFAIEILEHIVDELPQRMFAGTRSTHEKCGPHSKSEPRIPPYLALQGTRTQKPCRRSSVATRARDAESRVGNAA